MSKILIIGGSVAGLFSGMLLARRGHDVTILERDERARLAPPIDAPVQQRAGAPHAVHGHGVLARATTEIRRALPDVVASLLSAGVKPFDLVAEMPESIEDRAPRAGDDDLIRMCARRHAFDTVLTAAALAERRLQIRYGETVTELVGKSQGPVPYRVTGARTANGQLHSADVIIDASGRRSPVSRLLAGAGVHLPIETSDCGIVYYTRHYQIRPGVQRPALNGIFLAAANLPSLWIRWFLGDNDTAMLVQGVLAEDSLLKSVQKPDRFEAVARSVPGIAPWLECADPISDVFAMGALQNTLRRTAQDGKPLMLGLHLVGDAICTTNPTMGRGVSMAAIGAVAIDRVIAAQPEDPVAQACKYDDLVALEIEPCFRENVLYDRALAGRMRADLTGQAMPPPASPPDGGVTLEELMIGSRLDADLYRDAMRYTQFLSDRSSLAEPGFVERVRRIVPAGSRAEPLPGPTRAKLESIISAA